MTDQRVRIALSFIIIVFYLALVFFVLQHETFGDSGPHEHPDNMMGELKILIGVLTAGVGQILSYWFSKKDPN